MIMMMLRVMHIRATVAGLMRMDGWRPNDAGGQWCNAYWCILSSPGNDDHCDKEYGDACWCMLYVNSSHLVMHTNLTWCILISPGNDESWSLWQGICWWIIMHTHPVRPKRSRFPDLVPIGTNIQIWSQKGPICLSSPEVVWLIIIELYIGPKLLKFLVECKNSPGATD